MAKPGPDERVSEEDILREIALSPDPVVTAAEIAERTDYTRSNVNYRLSNLVESGDVKRKEVGARAVVYWITDAGRKRLYEPA